MAATPGVEPAPVAEVTGLFEEVLKGGAVDPDADFFELGGDSLLAVALIGRMREQVTRDAALRWVFDGRTARALAELAAGAAPPLAAGDAGDAAPGQEAVPAAAGSRAEASGAAAAAAGSLPGGWGRAGASDAEADGFLAERLPAGRIVPSTAAQRRVWLFERLHPDSRAYQFCGLIRLRGALDVDALRRALAGLLDRHAALRAAFAERDGEPVQVVGERPPLPLEVVDLRDRPKRAYADEVRRAARRRIDAREGPLIRWTLLRQADDEWSLVHAEHHLCHDGWSFAVCVDDLAALYAHHAAGAPAPPPPRAQLADVARREQELRAAGVFGRQLDHWRRVLDPTPEPLALPLDRPRPAHAVHRGGAIRHRVGAGLCDELRALARAEGATLFMACLAAHAVQLARLDDRRRVQVGTGIANRRVPAHEDVAGMVINTVALPLDLSGDPTVRELLRRVRETTIEAYENGDVPFDAVVEAIAPPRGAGRQPLFETLFSFHDAPGGKAPWPGLECRALCGLPDGSAKADLNIIGLDDRDGGVTFHWEHSELLTDATAARLATQHEHLLRALVDAPDARVSELDVVPAEEAARIAGWEVAPARHDRAATLHGLVLEQARRTPRAEAVRHDGGSMTYAELEAASGALASRLRAAGVAPGDRVGILLPRCADGLVAHLAVLRAGAAYVPLDPEHPASRNARALTVAGAAVAVTTPELAAGLPDGVAALAPAGDAAPDPGDLDVGAPGDLAYLMFTSGSTGLPKGVAITQGNIVALVHRCGFADFGPGSVTLHAATTAFDAATLEIWGPLVAGGTVAVLDDRSEPDALAQAVARHGVTVLYLTAGLFHAVVDWRPELLAGLDQMIAGGDVVSAPHALRALAVMRPGARMTDGYGPTEITTFASAFDVPRDWPEEQPLPIGRPLPATTCRVADARGRRTPVGVAGELWVGGDGVAAGYWDDDELTAQRFVVRDGERWYRTGDRAAWRADGTIEFLGRLDNQVKIRGYRVEPGEVEAVLREHPALADVAVVVQDLGGGDRRLIAHVVPAPGATESPAALRAWAEERLPSAMVPAAWPRHERFPLNASGKVDRRALPEPTREHVATGAGDGDGEAFRDDLERALATIFERVLGVRPVGPRDDFFALGGHSLLALALCDAVERTTGRRIAPATVFEAPTPRALAEGLRRSAPRRASSSLVVLRAEGDGAPLACVTAGDGNPLAFAALARRLPEGRPVVALQPHGIDGHGLLDRDVDAIARRYVDHLRRFRPRGPYLLAGRCNGAAVALAMAHLLREAGEDVPLLAVLDTGAPLLAPAALAPGVARDRTVGSAVGRARRDGGSPPAGGEALAAWMREEVAPGVTRHLAEVWRWREDVAGTLPDPLGEDALRLAAWGWASGVAEGSAQPALLAPAPLPGCALRDGRRWDPVLDLVWHEVGEGEPFSAAGTARFLRALREPAGAAGATRYLLAAHALRQDLREAFPDPADGDAGALVDWAWRYGVGEGLQADLLGQPPGPRERLAVARARGGRAARAAAGDPRRVRRAARERAGRALWSAARLGVVAERRLPRTLNGATARRHELARRLAENARFSYRATPWPGRVLHVRSPSYGDAPRYDAWWAVAGTVDEVVVEVPHAEMLRDPGAAAVAAALQDGLAAAGPGR